MNQEPSATDALHARLQTIEDIEEIRKLKARYCQACDDDHNPVKLGPLFAEDGTWEAAVTGRAEGRSAIQELLASVGTSGRILRSAHNVFNPIIEVDGNNATGDWRLLMLYTGIYPNGDLHYSRIIGWYKDNYRKIDGQWYIQSLFCHVEENAPYAITQPDAE